MITFPFLVLAGIADYILVRQMTNIIRLYTIEAIGQNTEKGCEHERLRNIEWMRKRRESGKGNERRDREKLTISKYMRIP